MLLKINVFLQLEALILASSLFVVRLKQKNIGMLKDYTFTGGIILCVLLQAADIAMRWFTYTGSISQEWIPIFVKLYLALLMANIFAGVLYFAYSILDEKDHKRYMIVSLAIVLAASVIMFIFRTQSVSEDLSVNIQGGAYLFACIFCWVSIAVLCATLIIRRKRYSNVQKLAIILWSVVCTAGIIAEFVSKTLPCAGASVSLGLLIISLLLENPEGIRDNSLELFHYDIFIEFLRFAFVQKKSMAIVYVYLHNDSNEYSKEAIIDATAGDAIRMILENHKVALFRLKRNEFIVACDDARHAAKVSTELQEFFDNAKLSLSFANRFPVSEIVIEDVLLADSPADLMTLIDENRRHTETFDASTEVITIDHDMIERLHDELSVVADLDYAIENDTIRLEYQPVYSLEKERYVGAEALVRVYGKDGTQMLPGRFIPIAEKYGKMQAFEARILRKASSFFTDLRKRGVLLDDISINISTSQISDPDFVNSIIDVVADCHISPDNICIEITDVNMTKDWKLFMDNASRLMSFGVTLSVTGYGSENSNLNYVIGLPIDVLRLDRRFVWDAVEHDKNKRILKGSLKMIKQLKKRVVAVGIETQQQFDLMKENGVSLLQGIYFSKPLSESDFLEFVSKGTGESV